MKDFLLVIRYPGDPSQTTPERLKEIQKKWESWFQGIVAQGKFSNVGSRLSAEGKVLKSGGVITDGPFVEIKEKLGGFLVVKADNLEEAVTLAHGCPAMEVDGSVEIRPFFT